MQSTIMMLAHTRSLAWSSAFLLVESCCDVFSPLALVQSFLRFFCRARLPREKARSRGLQRLQRSVCVLRCPLFSLYLKPEAPHFFRAKFSENITPAPSYFLDIEMWGRTGYQVQSIPFRHPMLACMLSLTPEILDGQGSLWCYRLFNGRHGNTHPRKFRPLLGL